MIANIKWGTFLFWGVCDFLIAVGVYFLLTETRGLSLESIAHTRADSSTKLTGEYSSGVEDAANKTSADGKAPGIGIQ